MFRDHKREYISLSYLTKYYLFALYIYIYIYSLDEKSIFFSYQCSAAVFQRHSRPPPLPGYQNVKSQNGKIPPHHLRVQSPNRNDFKDFSTSGGPGGTRDLRSPVKQLNHNMAQMNPNQPNGKKECSDFVLFPRNRFFTCIELNLH